MALYTFEGKWVKTPGRGKYWVADNAVVLGDVTLEEDVSVWFGSSLRGDNEPIFIGRGTNIQEGCCLHTDPGLPIRIGEYVTVGHMALVHGCTIEDGALIGMGAIVLNGAKIGAGSLIAAGALVGENKEIPPGSLVMGSPGKVVKQLSPELIERMKRGATHYAAKWKRFATNLQRQEE